VGSVVLAIHDASDVFLEIGKLTKYYGWEIVPSIVFVIFAISWVVLRLIYFPLHVIWSTRYVFALLLACTWYTLLWSQQFSIMFFQLAVLTVISQLSWSRLIIARGVRAVSQTMTHHKMRSVLFFMRTCGPGVPNMINYMFSTHLQLSNGKQLFLQQETRPYVS